MRQLVDVKETSNHAVSTYYIVSALAFSGVAQCKFSKLYDFTRWAECSQRLNNALAAGLVFGAFADGVASADGRHLRSLQIEVA
ncbi:hypothetical protein Pla144_03650 [Bythopirellula polymerisocia]|uniref:Uncharacterized protein n=1 Tax=Bythopirellula polymerisocia TaxID=2528003 RepID=A0A5C6D1Q9_9BACT|nr:hypothetical protein Pla144_03650 [Bythopirellula polymerisocia]